WRNLCDLHVGSGGPGRALDDVAGKAPGIVDPGQGELLRHRDRRPDHDAENGESNQRDGTDAYATAETRRAHLVRQCALPSVDRLVRALSGAWNTVRRLPAVGSRRKKILDIKRRCANVTAARKLETIGSTLGRSLQARSQRGLTKATRIVD